MTTWYSIAISLPPSAKVIFNGYFSVNNANPSIVTSFYEKINGSTNFSNSILADNNFYGAGYGFLKDSLAFSYNGPNITYMNYYSNPASPNYDANYAFFQLWSEPVTGSSSRNPFLTPLTASGDAASADLLAKNIIIQISDPSCYNEGTKILCLNKQLAEEYIAIELLRKGDIVKSYKHGYRRVDLIGKNSMINDPNRFTNCMYKMEKTAENGLIEDLIITGGHSILVDDLGIYKEKNDKIFSSTLMVDDKYLLLSAVSKDFTKIENNNLYTYYHFTLENDGDDDKRFGVWANGILTETPSKNYFTKNFITK